MGTVAALVLIALGYYTSFEVAIAYFPYVATAITAAFLVAFAMGNLLTATALQTAELRTTTGIVGLFRQDWQVWIIHGCILGWALLTLSLALVQPTQLTFHPGWVVAAWLVLTGVVLDLASHLYWRVLRFLNPFTALQIIQEQATRDIRAGRDIEFCQRVESLAETGLRASRIDGLSLCRASIEAVRVAVQQDLAWHQRSLRVAEPDSEASQRAGYMLNYACQRLALIYVSAHEGGLHSLCQDVMSALGKIAVAASDVQWNLVAGPILMMGHLTKQAVQEQDQAAGIKFLIMLVQVSKRILSEQDQSKAPLQKAFIPIIRQMDDVAKECFRQDKTVAISTLTNPFQELKRIFEHERLSTHPDQATIVSQLDRTLADFANLELVLKTLPPLPVTEERGS